jgi:hypothetical protein
MKTMFISQGSSIDGVCMVYGLNPFVQHSNCLYKSINSKEKRREAVEKEREKETPTRKKERENGTSNTEKEIHLLLVSIVRNRE